MPDDHFRPEVAASYDASVAGMFDPVAVEPVVEVLSELVGDGRALEFAIGTGRIALPSAARIGLAQVRDLSRNREARRARPA